MWGMVAEILFVVFWTVVQAAVFAYFVSLNLTYATLLLLSTVWCREYKKRSAVRPIDFDALANLKNLVPPVTIIIPAYNEEKVIVQSVRSLLAVEYSKTEVVVVNDGSRDETLRRLIDSFSLFKAHVLPGGSLPTRPIRSVYVSSIEPRLLVVDKENGGKSDALNVGINFSKAPYFLAVDADSIVEPAALACALRPVLEAPDRVVAVGGIVRGANGSIVDSGRVRRPRLELNFWVLVQAVEYIRSFLGGRAGWSFINGLLIVPGAFGLFQKAACMKVGGYSSATVAEDLELILRMHRHSYERKLGWQISFAPDAVCWTEMPSTGRELARQRMRWHEGLWQAISVHRGMTFRGKFGTVGMLALPHQILHELGGPLVELAGVTLIPIFYFLNLLSFKAFVLFLALAFFAGSLFSLFAIFIDHLLFPRYRFPRDTVLLLLVALLENFGFRQLSMVWRLAATRNFFFGKVSWRALPRTGFVTRILL
jgi:cellulose synthase/poly-beta-1,6-N-acetylglucosamine synthase-like glycosyltransferase